MKKRLFQATVILSVIVLVGCLASSVVSIFSTTSNPSTDYLALINGPILAAPYESKGWTIYRDLFAKYGRETPEWDSSLVFMPDENGNRIGRFVGPDDGEAWQEAIDMLAAADDLMEGLRVGGVRPAFGLPLHADLRKYDRVDLQALYPGRNYRDLLDENRQQQALWEQFPLLHAVPINVASIGRIRWACQLLNVDTRWAMEQVDTERITRNIEAVLGMSKQVTEIPFRSASLSAFFLQAIGFDMIDGAVHSQIEFSNTQLDRIHASVRRSAVPNLMGYSAEKALFLEIVQGTYTDDGNGNGRLLVNEIDEWNDLYVLLTAPTRRPLTDKANELFEQIDAVTKNLASDQPSVTMLEIESIVDQSQGFSMLHDHLAAERTIGQVIVRAKANANGVDVALAVLRFQRKNGRFPDGLDELVGEFMTRIPDDPFDGRPLRYGRRDEGFLIYSVGVNGSDDGGQNVLVRADGSVVTDPTAEVPGEERFKMHPYGYNLSKQKPGDWVLWPRYVLELERAGK
ncbi:MAG: hypothetical protein JNL67_21880 [Planctomycetaceae bacterium]|nr:hypothetical protein [Planctomycetaceae bacterium]